MNHLLKLCLYFISRLNLISEIMEDRIDRFGVPIISLNDNDLSERLAAGPNVSISKENEYGESISSALLGLFFYSSLMFTVPIASFFVMKYYLEENFDLGYTYNLLIPTGLSVVLVNIIIAFYVFRAFREDKKDHEIRSGPIEQRKKRE